MREYGDYIRETKRLLQNYTKMKVAVTNLTEEIDAQEMILRDESISSIQYGDDRICGGTRELTITEAAAARRIKLEEHITDMRIRRDEMERTIRAIDRAFESLDDADVEVYAGAVVDRDRGCSELYREVGAGEKRKGAAGCSTDVVWSDC